MSSVRSHKRPRALDLGAQSASVPPPRPGAREPDAPAARKRHCSPAMLTPTLSMLTAATDKLRTSPTGRSFFDLDLLECGVAKEVVAPNKLKPLPASTEWTYSYVRKVRTAADVGKDVKKFSMYSEADDTFLLSAVFHDGSFYISQQELFPAAFDPKRTLNDQELEGRYIAMLKPKRRKGEFQLVTFSCENCDTRLGKYSCGLMPTPDRQVLMELKHACPQLDSDLFLTARQLTVHIPPTFVDGTREVWCPRCPRGTGKGRTRRPGSTTPAGGGSSTARGLGAGAGAGAGVGVPPSSNSFRSVRSTSFTTTGGSFRVDESGPDAPLSGASGSSGFSSVSGSSSSASAPARVALSKATLVTSAGAPKALGLPPPMPPTPVPSWVADAARRSRKKSPSPDREMRFAHPLPDATNPHCVELKSRLPDWSRETKSLTMEFSGGRIRESSSRNFLLDTNEYEEVLQFGKATSRKFVLDVKHPLSLLQGFGAFLSVFMWTVTPKTPRPAYTDKASGRK